MYKFYSFNYKNNSIKTPAWNVQKLGAIVKPTFSEIKNIRLYTIFLFWKNQKVHLDLLKKSAS